MTVGIGYLTFIRSTPSAESLRTGPVEEDLGPLDDRVTSLERRLDALGRALTD